MICMSEKPDHPGFIGLAKYNIGDMIKVIKITLMVGDHVDTRRVFLKALGKEFPIEEITLWETNKEETPWFITYEIKVGDMDTIFLKENEIEKVKPA